MIKHYTLPVFAIIACSMLFLFGLRACDTEYANNQEANKHYADQNYEPTYISPVDQVIIDYMEAKK